MTEVYSAAFFQDQRAGSLGSAGVILPLLAEMFRPTSILDVGCGQGTWLRAALNCGIADVMGIDGGWARPALGVPQRYFGEADLAAPVHLGRKFDLAISVEVGEHIDASHDATFVANLVRHSDVVIFSAAIPFQGGTHHVNERWPQEWAAMFSAHGYRCFDFLRWRIWNDRRIATWYRQNIMVFANSRNTECIERLERLAAQSPPHGLAVVHPEMWTAMMNAKGLRLQRALQPVTRRWRGFFRLLRTRLRRTAARSAHSN